MSDPVMTTVPLVKDAFDAASSAGAVDCAGTFGPLIVMPLWVWLRVMLFPAASVKEPDEALICATTDEPANAEAADPPKLSALMFAMLIDAVVLCAEFHCGLLIDAAVLSAAELSVNACCAVIEIEILALPINYSPSILNT
jgi:hypothetical protein